MILTFFDNSVKLSWNSRRGSRAPNVTMLHEEDNNTRGSNVMKNVLAPGEYIRRIYEKNCKARLNASGCK